MYARALNAGVTAIELLLALSAVLVITAFASPIWSSLSSSNDMNLAFEQVEATLDKARQSTQVFHTQVVVNLHTDPATAGSLSFATPSLNNPHEYLNVDNQNFVLPETIRMTADRPVIKFNVDGTVETPMLLTLASTVDEGQVRLVQVE